MHAPIRQHRVASIKNSRRNRLSLPDAPETTPENPGRQRWVPVLTAKLCTNRILARLGELQPKKMLFLQVFLLTSLFSNKIYFHNVAASSCASCGTRCEFHNTPQFMHQVIHNACGQDAHIEWENTIKLLGYTRYRSHVGSDAHQGARHRRLVVSIRAPVLGQAQSGSVVRCWRRLYVHRSAQGVCGEFTIQVQQLQKRHP